MLKRAAEKAGLGIKVHAHMLRTLADSSSRMMESIRAPCKATLGIRIFKHTVRYTELSQTGSRTFGRIEAIRPTLIENALERESGLFFIRET